MPECRMEIQSFEENYMIGVAAKEKSVLKKGLPEVLVQFESLHLGEDVMRVARESRGC